jgi:hypothetical protein
LHVLFLPLKYSQPFVYQREWNCIDLTDYFETVIRRLNDIGVAMIVSLLATPVVARPRAVFEN